MKPMEKKDETKSKWLHLRLSREEHAKLHKDFKNSTCRSLSEFARKKVMGQLIITTYRNASMDGVMNEMIRLRTELNAIGNNYNQVVKKMHTLQSFPEFKAWAAGHSLQSEKLAGQLEALLLLVQKFGLKWLR